MCVLSSPTGARAFAFNEVLSSPPPGSLSAAERASLTDELYQFKIGNNLSPVDTLLRHPFPRRTFIRSAALLRDGNYLYAPRYNPLWGDVQLDASHDIQWSTVPHRDGVHCSAFAKCTLSATQRIDQIVSVGGYGPKHSDPDLGDPICSNVHSTLYCKKHHQKLWVEDGWRNDPTKCTSRYTRLEKLKEGEKSPSCEYQIPCWNAPQFVLWCTNDPHSYLNLCADHQRTHWCSVSMVKQTLLQTVASSTATRDTQSATATVDHDLGVPAVDHQLSDTVTDSDVTVPNNDTFSICAGSASDTVTDTVMVDSSAAAADDLMVPATVCWQCPFPHQPSCGLKVRCRTATATASMVDTVMDGTQSDSDPTATLKAQYRSHMSRLVPQTGLISFPTLALDDIPVSAVQFGLPLCFEDIDAPSDAADATADDDASGSGTDPLLSAHWLQHSQPTGREHRLSLVSLFPMIVSIAGSVSTQPVKVPLSSLVDRTAQCTGTSGNPIIVTDSPSRYVPPPPVPAGIVNKYSNMLTKPMYDRLLSDNKWLSSDLINIAVHLMLDHIHSIDLPTTVTAVPATTLDADAVLHFVDGAAILNDYAMDRKGYKYDWWKIHQHGGTATATASNTTEWQLPPRRAQIYCIDNAHWVLSESILCPGAVTLWDSFPDTVPQTLNNQLIQIHSTDYHPVKPDCNGKSQTVPGAGSSGLAQKQGDESSCGLFALARLVDLLYTDRPRTVKAFVTRRYNVNLMRMHFRLCLLRGIMTPFPLSGTPLVATQQELNTLEQYHTGQQTSTHYLGNNVTIIYTDIYNTHFIYTVTIIVCNRCTHHTYYNKYIVKCCTVCIILYGLHRNTVI